LVSLDGYTIKVKLHREAGAEFITASPDCSRWNSIFT